MPGRDPGGFIVTALIGIVGAVIGGFLGNMIFGIGGVSGVDIRSILIAVVGALLLLWIYRMATRRSAV
ncbi:GlsB/YeaQ/YmgE family stress response membrane protein [Roseisolibacter agri]